MEAKADTVEREKLLEKYDESLVVNYNLNRSLVSFQANKKLPFYSWFKYKEGFAKPFVDYCLDSFGEHGVLLDPFAGSGAALFAAAERGMSTIGIELLPSAISSINARKIALEIEPDQFERCASKVSDINLVDYYSEKTRFNHINITRSAFPENSERQISGYLNFVNSEIRPKKIRTLLQFAACSVLEEVSYTRKDGQFLRWDQRSGRTRSTFDKGHIPDFQTAIIKKIKTMVNELHGRTSNGQLSLHHFENQVPSINGNIDVIQGSCLHKLRGLDSNSVNLVITSPPYCNRYDYTRTYALELAFLGCSDEKVNKLRQTMLSCTVENKSKVKKLKNYYRRNGMASEFATAVSVFDNQKAFHEVWNFLESEKDNLPNKSVPRMVWNYFFEMNLVIQQIARIIKSGGQIVMVNDNVQYHGEEVPVDIILSDYAESYGLKTDVIWVLPKGKGNASQQMGKHGRTEIRKCVYIWSKT